ncbi:MAG: type IX secretion system sortase PorU [Bacteroidota bacterium]
MATGQWYKIGVKEAGVYKVTVPQLGQLGINATNIASSAIRLYGNGGGMLPENNALPRYDDLQENALLMNDGGDGVFNGADYFLFYSNGADSWQRDSINRRFSHTKNLYSDLAYYFISVGGTGKRMATSNFTASPNQTIRAFDDRYFFEKDSINFLNSGREWFGDEFSNTPGNLLTRTYTTPLSNLVPNAPVSLQYSLAGRSVAVPSRFDVRINNQLAGQSNIIAVSGGFLDAFITQATQIVSGPSASGTVNLSFSFAPGNMNAQGWLNWFEVFARRNLSMQSTDQLLFRDWASVGTPNMGEFFIANFTAALQVWNITDPLQPYIVQGSTVGGEYRFVHPTNRLHEFIAFTGNNIPAPQNFGLVENQNLHAASIVDFIIITPPQLLPQASRLAQHHRTKDNLRTLIVTTSQVFNEFSSGSGDPTAIRDYVKMYYDRAAGDSTRQPKYLLLFGDASFDYKNRVGNNTNLVPAYESVNSSDPLITHTTDDYFGYLDDLDDIAQVAPAPLLDIGIGRLPVTTDAEAKIMVDKIIHYTSPATHGPWRNAITFVADDEDANLHFNDAETISATAAATDRLLNQNKIYLDAYRQESGNGGSRYPLVNQAITSQMQNGNLIWNYNGHGGYNRLADEAVLEQSMTDGFNNENKLPLFITATCDFAPYDNPAQPSIGEYLLHGSAKGAIALMTTTRLVFANSNKLMNDNYLRIALQPVAGQYLRLGDATKQAKNYTYQFSGDILNNRKFTLLGDPALRLAFPTQKLALTTLDNKPIISGNDSLKALGRYTFGGEVRDAANQLLTGFNGTLYASIFDKPQTISTLANDPGSNMASFQSQNNLVYKGKVKVENGTFNFQFIVPKDINYQFGKSRISLYAGDGQQDANGINSDILVGGNSSITINDNTGPEIKPYLNDEKFVNGGITAEKPLLLVKLADSSGINTVGTGIGHDITAIIDNNPRNTIVLNDFYEGETGSYQKGTIRFQLPELEEGPHSLNIKAWDVVNNSGTATIDFTVRPAKALTIAHVFNYPNPFTTSTNFWFEHNQPGSQLNVRIRIFTLAGKIVKEIVQPFFSTGTRMTDIFWDGKDQFGSKLAKGVYVYELIVQAANGEKKSSFQKLYLL